MNPMLTSESGRFFPRYFGALLARFRQSNGDSLFAAGYLAASPGFSRTECAALLPAHRTRHGFARGLAISAACCFSSGAFLGCHHASLQNEKQLVREEVAPEIRLVFAEGETREKLAALCE